MTAKQWLEERLVTIEEELGQREALLCQRLNVAEISWEEFSQEAREIREWAEGQKKATLEDVRRAGAEFAEAEAEFTAAKGEASDEH